MVISSHDTSFKKIGEVYALMREIGVRVSTGEIDADYALQLFKAVLDGTPLEMAPPSADIVTRVERQLRRYEELGITIPDEVRLRIIDQAWSFVPRSTTDCPLVTGFFGYDPDALSIVWRKVGNRSFNHRFQFSDDFVPTTFAQGMEPTVTTPRLVHFDQHGYEGLSPNQAVAQATQNGIRVAGVEIVEMLLVEPVYGAAWGEAGHPYPLLSALRVQVADSNVWTNVPYVMGCGFDAEIYTTGPEDDIDPEFTSVAIVEC